MSAPKEPYPLPSIPTSMLRYLRVGESMIVGPCNPTKVSAEFTRLPGKHVQQQVIVVEPRSVNAQKMFAVTRVE